MIKKFMDHDLIGAPVNQKSFYDNSAPYPSQEVSFNWLNSDYAFLHTHDYFEIYIITNGNFTHYINNELYNVSAGDACLIRPNDCHKLVYSLSENGHHLNFMIKPEYAKLIFDSFGPDVYDSIIKKRTALNFSLNQVDLSKIINTITPLINTKSPIKSRTMRTKVIVSYLLSEMLIQKIVRSNTFPQWFLSFLKELNNPTKKYNVKELAKQTNYSYSRLSRIFKDYMDITIVTYINNIKINYACNLLCNTDMSIIQIANELNYESIGHFNKLFKNQMHVTPSEYRQKSKKR